MIEIQQLSVGYGADWSLKGVDMTIPTGAMLAITGEAGCGKSTLLRALAGWQGVEAGMVRLDGVDIRCWPEKALAMRCAWMSQNVEARVAMTALEYASLHEPQASGPCARRSPVLCVRKALELMGMGAIACRGYHTLSYSEQRRVQIARVLSRALGPQGECLRYVFLDEPELGLDAAGRENLLQVLDWMRRGGKTVVAALGDARMIERWPGTIYRMPRSSARNTALVRSRTPSLPKMVEA
jgi:ABC-type cobalamin/Fe3+-siderophores transport system ATPase subunit